MFTFSFPVIFIDLKFAPLVTLVQRYIFAELEAEFA